MRSVRHSLADDGRQELSLSCGEVFGERRPVDIECGGDCARVRLPGPLLTNVRQLADIRGFYEAFDLAVAEGRNDRADHVCFETEFLAHLDAREAHLRRVGDREGVAIVVDVRRSFLEDHLGRWAWRFAAEVSGRDDGFYAALAGLLSSLVEVEVETLDADPDWVPDAPGVTEWNEGVFGDAGRGCGGCGADVEGLDGVPAGPPTNPDSRQGSDGDTFESR